MGATMSGLLLCFFMPLLSMLVHRLRLGGAFHFPAHRRPHVDVNDLLIGLRLSLWSHIAAAGIHYVADSPVGLYDHFAVVHIGDKGERTQHCHNHHLTAMY